ncbi:DUF2147 domain-containing protein [Flavobacteriaceae bacterium LSUCC0859]|nr:DUF2147 domain-containing protein [Flavobacteriaceae bacterium LSUCC0859]
MMHLFLWSLLWLIQTAPVTGTWVSIDDETGVEKSEITLYESQGKLYGKVKRLLLPEDQGKLCVNCKGAEKNKPIEGLVIVKGLSKDGETWTDGKIMDPANGKNYDCTISLENSNTLKVRGYLGFSFLGRTQTWKRKE